MFNTPLPTRSLPPIHYPSTLFTYPYYPPTPLPSRSLPPLPPPLHTIITISHNWSHLKPPFSYWSLSFIYFSFKIPLMTEEQTSQTKSFFNILNTDTPLKDFFDLRKSSIPVSYELAKNRIESNLLRFKTYYLGISLLFMIIFTFLRPSFLVFLGLMGLFYYLHQTKPTIKGYKLDSNVLNISTGVCLLVCGIIFSNTLVSILALVSLTSITILSHAVTLDKEEDIKEVGV